MLCLQDDDDEKASGPTGEKGEGKSEGKAGRAGKEEAAKVTLLKIDQEYKPRGARERGTTRVSTGNSSSR